MKRQNHLLRSAVACLATSAASFAVTQVQAAELLERAVLPSASFSTGPTSGQFATGGNGVVTPFINKQPVQGFSAVLPGAHDGTYLVMSDNGFGNKANSNDALLRVYAVRPDFEAGTVAPVNRFTGETLSDFTSESFITLSDPWNRVPFAIVADGAVYPSTPVGGGAAIPVDPSIKANRLLTGSDFDIESIRRAPDGTLWFGDEFGPYLIHTDSKGRVLEAPIPLPNFRKLPSTLGGSEVNPLIQAVSNPVRTLPANLADSGGFEGMALNASGTKLYALLEKAVAGDPVRERLLINEFNLKDRKYTGKTFAYPMESASNAIGDFTALTDTQFLIIERDSGQGDASDVRFTNPARFKRIYKIDLKSVDANGLLIKEEVADLMNIYDPRDVAGDGKAKTVFTFPFTTIEDVLVLDNNRLLVINDNNYPGSAGREFGVPDNNEFIVIHTAPLLDCDGGKRKDKDARDWYDGGRHDRGDKECRPAKN
ncbi:esterase-like activity of phytase family protein [Steroidobacter sp.]|uniref:esterase-like activity of phytase family protein n=1 Tax=Steroidobacter sp. TaxID=1978227 RepID=UPI001A3C4F28|nr:esterase-like activity of phytase family protein [Steroidobacter sp.]MBL8270291.1 esterase-like activity of phytase family protein [Steroidobacter sp.]